MTTPDAEDELAALQRRAYGPGEQAPLDPAELARLHELEEQLRVATPVPLSGEEPTDQPPEPAPATDPPVDTAPPLEPVRRWWRSPRLWAAASAGLVVGVAATLGVTALQHPPPDVVLHRAAEQDHTDLEDHDAFSYLNLDPDSIVIFEPWHDARVWTAERGDGALCLVVGSGVNEGYFDLGCALDGLDPQIDLPVFPGLSGAFGVDLRNGSTVRFVARADTVDVWIREAGAHSDVFSG